MGLDNDCEWPRYRELVSLVCSHDFAVVSALCSVTDVTEVEPVAKCLLATCVRHGDALQMVRACVRNEFTANASRPAQIFRTQNLASRAVGAHARMIGAGYLRHTLGAVVTALMNERVRLEVDPMRSGADPDEQATRLNALRLWSELFITRITVASALADMPHQMRDLLSEIWRAATDLGLDQKQAGRLPAIATPPPLVAPEWFLPLGAAPRHGCR